MSDYTLSQTTAISNLPRDYLSLLKNSLKKGEPVILMKHNKPVGALVAKKVLDKLMAFKIAKEEQEALQLIHQGEEEYRLGKTTTKLPK